MRNAIILTTMISLSLPAVPSEAADIYLCQAKERLLLNDDGLVRPVPRMGINPQFMIDKNTGNAVGEIFPGSPTWQITQSGSTANSLVSQGRVMGRSVYKVAIYSFNAGKEKPFVVEDRGSDGVFEIFSGICK